MICLKYCLSDVKSSKHPNPTNSVYLVGGTDIIACFMGQNWTVPVYRGQVQGFTLGCDMAAWDDSGNGTDGVAQWLSDSSSSALPQG